MPLYTVGRVLDGAGCKLHGLWYSFGEGDGFALFEAPDNKAMAGVAIAAPAEAVHA